MPAVDFAVSTPALQLSRESHLPGVIGHAVDVSIEVSTA